MSGFQYFQKLPPELRYKIWELDMAPRQIRVRANCHRPGMSILSLPLLVCPPPALHVCRDSRTSMMRYYRKAFYGSKKCSPYSERGLAAPYTWVNYDLDVFCIHERHLALLALGPHRRLIRHVEVYCHLADYEWFSSPGDDWFWYGAWLFELPCLRSAQLINASSAFVGVVENLLYPLMALGLMIDCYATCWPIDFDLRILDLNNRELGWLNRSNFRDHLETSHRHIVKLEAHHAGADCPDDIDYRVWNNKFCAGWKHVRCDCTHVAHLGQQSWRYRIDPTWQGGTHFTKYIGLAAYMDLCFPSTW